MPILILYMMFYVTYTTSFAPMCCFAPERPVMLCDIELLFASSRCVITSYRVCLRSQEVSDDIYVCYTQFSVQTSWVNRDLLGRSRLGNSRTSLQTVPLWIYLRQQIGNEWELQFDHCGRKKVSCRSGTHRNTEEVTVRRNYGVLTELVASVNKVFGNLKGQQEVARISLPVHGLHKTEDKVGTQTLKFCGETKQGHIMWGKKSFATQQTNTGSHND